MNESKSILYAECNCIILTLCPYVLLLSHTHTYIDSIIHAHMRTYLLRVFKFLLSFPPGQRRCKDFDEHDYAAEKDLQPPIHVPAH